MEELLSNIRLNGSDGYNDDNSVNNYFTGNSRYTFVAYMYIVAIIIIMDACI